MPELNFRYKMNIKSFKCVIIYYEPPELFKTKNTKLHSRCRAYQKMFRLKHCTRSNLQLQMQKA